MEKHFQNTRALIMYLQNFSTGWERLLYPSRKITEHQYWLQCLLHSNCNSIYNLKMYQHDGIDTTSIISFQ